MTLPSVLTVPLAALSPMQRRTFSRATNATLLAIFAWLAWTRFARPQWPVADSDGWGYLHPGIAKLLGGSFEHTFGRNFVYPGWIYLLLRATDDFRSIPVAQHVLGLATAALLWVFWRQWRGWFPASRLPAAVDASLGLGLVWFFGGASSVIHYEEQLRPESVFAFFALLNLCLLLAFLRAWYVELQPDRAAVFGGMTLFATVLVYQFKPSFGLAIGIALLPVGLAMILPWRRWAWRPKVRLFGALAAAALAVLVLLVLPERELAKSDLSASLFLPETLLTIHAGPIHDQMNEDVCDAADTPFPAPWLASTARYFDSEFRRAGDPSQQPYPLLGYNPDYLLYRDSFCRWLNNQLPPTQIASFCYYYYRRVWTRRPGTMLAKVMRELGFFYSMHCPAFRSSTKLRLAEYYGLTLTFLVEPSHQQMALYPPARVYVEAVRRLSMSKAMLRPPPLLVLADIIAAVTHLLLLVLFLAATVATAFLPPGSRRVLWLPGAALWLVYGICFGNCLTVSVVHAMTIHRYSLNLLVYVAPCEAATLAWLGEFVLLWRDRKPAPRPVGTAAAIPFAGPPFFATDTAN